MKSKKSIIFVLLFIVFIPFSNFLFLFSLQQDDQISYVTTPDNFIINSADHIPLWSYQTGNDIRGVSISDNGEYIAAVNYDGNLYFFHRADSSPKWSYSIGAFSKSVDISADGEFIVLGAYDDKVYLFNKSSSIPMWEYDTGGDIWSVTISADGTYIVAGNINSIFLFNKSSSIPMWTNNTGEIVRTVSISENGDYIAAGTDGGYSVGKIYLFNKASANPLWCYDAEDRVWSVSVTEDGFYLAAGGADEQVHYFNRTSSTPMWSYQFDGTAYSVSISSNGEYILAGAYKSAYLFHNSSSTPQWNYLTGNEIRSVSISSDGYYLAVGSWDQKVYMFNRTSSVPMWDYITGDWVGRVAISGNGQYIVAGSYDNHIYLFHKSNPPTSNHPDDFTTLTTGNENINWILTDEIGGGKYRVWTEDLYGTYYVCIDWTPWENNTDLNVPINRTYIGTYNYSIEYNNSGGAYGMLDTVFVTVDCATHQQMWDYDTGATIRAVDITPDGANFVVANDDNRVYYYYKNSSSAARIYFLIPYGNARDVAISEDGHYIIVGGENDYLYLYSNTSDAPIWTYDALEDVLSVDISADGTYIAAGGFSDRVYLFNRTYSTPLWENNTGQDISSVSISADGQYIVAGGKDNKVHLFNRNDAEPLWSYQGTGEFRVVTITSDGEYIAAGNSYEDKIYLFNKSSSTPEWSKNLSTFNKYLAMSSDGQYIACSTGDGRACLFNRTSQKLIWEQQFSGDPFPWAVEEVSISGNGQYFVFYNNKFLYLANQSRILWKFELGTTLADVKISDDGKYIIAGTDLGRIYFFNTFDRPNSNTPEDFETLQRGESTINWTLSDELEGGQYRVWAEDIDGNPYVWQNWTYWENNTNLMVPINRSFTGVFNYTIEYNNGLGLSGTPDTVFVTVTHPPIWSYTNDDDIQAVAISSDGRYLVAGTASPNGEKIYLFDSFNSTPIWIFDAGGSVNDVDISENGQYIASVDGNNYFRLFQKQSSTPFMNVNLGSIGRAVAMSEDGFYIAVGTANQDVIMYKRTSSTPLWQYDVGSNIQSIAISNDGEYIVVGTGDSGQEVFLFNKTSSNPMWSYSAGAGVFTVDISGDGGYITAGSYDNKVYLFNKSSSTPEWSNSTGNIIKSIAISSDGDCIAAMSNQVLYFFNRTNSTPQWTHNLGQEGYSVAISADGEFISASGGENVFLFNRTSDIPMWKQSTKGDNCEALAISADGRIIASGNNGDIICLFHKDLPPISNSPIDLNTYLTGSERINWTIWDPLGPGKYRVWANNTNDEYYIWQNWTPWVNLVNLQVPINRTSIGTFNYTIEFNSSANFSGISDTVMVNVTPPPPESTQPDDLTITTLSEDTLNWTLTDVLGTGKFRVWANDSAGNPYVWQDWADWQNNTNLMVPINITKGVYNYTIEYNNSNGLFGTPDTVMVTINLHYHYPLWSYSTSDALMDVDISKDGQYVVAGSYDYKVYLFNQQEPNPVWSYETGNIVRTVAISFDGNYIVAGSDDNKVYLFNKTSSTPMWIYSTGGDINSVAISDDGFYIVAGSDDDRIYLFNRTSSTPIWSYSSSYNFESVDISANGEYLVGGNSDDKAYLFHRNSSSPIWNVVGHTVSISGNGEYILAGWSPGNLRLYNNTSSTPMWNLILFYGFNTGTISADGEYIIVGSGRHLQVFGRNSSDILWDYYSSSYFHAVEASADGQYIAAVNDHGQIYYLNRSSSVALWRYDTGGEAWGVGISENGDYCAMGNYNDEVYLFHRTKQSPTSNHPDDIITTTAGTENIGWVCKEYEDKSGKYRVWSNDTNDQYYIWRDWTDWENNTNLNVPINRSAVGIYNYTIEYNNSDEVFGVPDSVIVIIDDDAPFIILDSPQNESILQKPTLIELTINDPNLNASAVEWRANVTQTSWTTTFTGSHDIDLSSFASDQTVQFWVRANDTADNSALDTFIFTFDDTNPSIVLDGPVNSTVLQKPALIELTITDANLNSSTLEWRANVKQAGPHPLRAQMTSTCLALPATSASNFGFVQMIRLITVNPFRMYSRLMI